MVFRLLLAPVLVVLGLVVLVLLLLLPLGCLKDAAKFQSVSQLLLECWPPGNVP